MKKSWWRSASELDDERKSFIQSVDQKRLLLCGPPGSGKTNLLLLRAEYVSRKGKPNILVITFTKTLANFIRTGIKSKEHIQPEKIKTYHSWAVDFIREQSGEILSSTSGEFDDELRSLCLDSILEINSKLASKKLYDAIFVDEAQDFSPEELKALLCLSDHVVVSGDVNQGIYHKHGLSVAEDLNLIEFRLKNHFRIGQRIAQIADKLIPPETDKESMESSSNYDSIEQGESSALLLKYPDRNSQYEEMLKRIRIQLLAFKDEPIGIICGKKSSCEEVYSRLKETDLKALVCFHGGESTDESDFNDSRVIHVLTIHSAKGTEFKAVHIYGAEELRLPFLRRTTLSFTAVTRAKTSLIVYSTGLTTAKLESAFAEEQEVELDDLFSE